jgi:hypothetical protein
MDDLDKPVWGAAAFADIINQKITQTNYLLSQRRLDADKVGRKWVSTPRRLLNLSGCGGASTQETHP